LLNRREHHPRHLPLRLPEGADPEGEPCRRLALACAVVHVASVRSGAVGCHFAAPVLLFDGASRSILERGWRRRLAPSSPRPRARRRPPRWRGAGTRSAARQPSAGAATARPPAKTRDGART